MAAMSAAVVFLLSGCHKNTVSGQQDTVWNDVMSISSRAVTDSFIGNGPQWGGYDMVPAWTGLQTLSERDWETLFSRVSFMRPGLMRIMVSSGWNYIDGSSFNPEKSSQFLFRILDWCQKNNVTVQFGEWGHTGGTVVDDSWADNAVAFLSCLVNEKGFTCIKYYTIVNEPNGSWSSTLGSYALWTSIIKTFYRKMQDSGLLGKVRIMGPDVAVWTISDTPWMSDTKNNLHDEVTAYDIHTYPDDKTVCSTEFSSLLDACRAASDRSRPIILGELGFKYDASDRLGKENADRISADKYAADDSQMHVYDSFYGIDMADATIQAMRAGYGGVTYWMLDDAMYNDTGSPDSKRLKRWGFWNILGTEVFENPDDENIRPWFYPLSLLCRFFPSGSTVLEVRHPLPVRPGLRATAAVKGGKVSVVIVNNSAEDHSFTLKSDAGVPLDNLDMYVYVSESGSSYEGATDESGLPLPAERGLSISSSGYEMTVPAESFIMFTNMD